MKQTSKKQRTRLIVEVVLLAILLAVIIFMPDDVFRKILGQDNTTEQPADQQTEQLSEQTAQRHATENGTEGTATLATSQRHATENGTGGISADTIAYELAMVIASQPEQVIKHIGYTVSYNPKWRVPNWVAYELTGDETSGDEERSNHFKPDPLVEGDPVVTTDYSNSGYDRGHMAPAADMKWSEQAMRESFYMTNMCPQLHNVNAGDWKSLEELARDWARQYGNIYIACGPVVYNNAKTIGTERKIKIPSSFYKVFLRQKEDGKWTAVGFVMPNKAGSQPLMTYLKTVDEIEAMVGIDFFYNLPDDIEEVVEADYNIEDWSLKR